MPKILSDINVIGHVRTLLDVTESERWSGIWREIECEVCVFQDLDLPDDATDSVIWQTCQENEIVLITANRNAEDPESLELTIRNRNNENCLPVLTLADPDRIQRDRAYAEQVVERLLEILLEVDAFRGAGRPYLP